jgi:hypothetical protein
MTLVVDLDETMKFLQAERFAPALTNDGDKLVLRGSRTARWNLPKPRGLTSPRHC